MPKDIDSILVLKEYVSGVIDKAEHHANNVEEVCLALAGAIIWKKDAPNIRILERKGEMKNVIWVQIKGKQYAFSYNHEIESIEMREETTHGNAIGSFNNSTTNKEIKEFFKKF